MGVAWPGSPTRNQEMWMGRLAIGLPAFRKQRLSRSKKPGELRTLEKLRPCQHMPPGDLSQLHTSHSQVTLINSSDLSRISLLRLSDQSNTIESLNAENTSRRAGPIRSPTWYLGTRTCLLFYIPELIVRCRCGLPYSVQFAFPFNLISVAAKENWPYSKQTPT